jgi:hypothetical protein
VALRLPGLRVVRSGSLDKAHRAAIETPRWRWAYRGYRIVRSGSLIRRIAPHPENPRWRCAYRGYGVVRSGSLNKAHRAAIGKLPGGAVLTGATGSRSGSLDKAHRAAIRGGVPAARYLVPFTIHSQNCFIVARERIKGEKLHSRFTIPTVPQKKSAAIASRRSTRCYSSHPWRPALPAELRLVISADTGASPEVLLLQNDLSCAVSVFFPAAGGRNR